MEEILLFVEEQQTWIYLLLAIAGLIYVRSIFRSYRELRRAVFALERERAMSMLIRSGAMLALVFAALAATFVVATFAGPALPLSSRQTPLPTVSLLATPETGEEGLVEDFVTATPFDPMSVNSTGCQNPNATITSPVDGDSVSGVVNIFGAASIQNFAFYKLEYRRLAPDAEWIPVSAGTQHVCELCDITEELGTWNTSLVIPGDYAFRLVVTDTAGNAPLPCEIRLRVLPSP
ncbi:MAG TPA: hypothetical protein G4O11_02470 [Anaerolineae bacterium]|nr:MAG: hypothetical protein AMJ88_17340 [Anaerolineae bacterium SM23_ 63]HEY42826.1 hypothetical protein [Anaerolineae bacterium]